jgi:hypothetical protein
MANFEPNRKGLAAFEKQATKALQEGVNAVAQRHAGASKAVIRSALVAEMKRRGFADFEPGDDLVKRIHDAGD